MNVLYVEDYAVAATLVRDFLRRRAPEIHLEIVATVAQALARLRRFAQAQDAAAATACAETPCYDLVLTDLSLPDGLGLEILSHVRQQGLPLAVVILTGSGQEDMAVAALRAGADDYVTKSDDYLAQLPRTLHVALERFLGDAARASTILRVLYADADIEGVEQARAELGRRAPQIVLSAVHGAAEVLAHLRRETVAVPDLVLIDDRLPGMSVIELVKQVGLVAGFDVPIVLVTGQGNERLAQLAIKIGAFDYLNKSDGYLQRLPFALESAGLRAASVRERSALRKSEAEFRTLADHLPDIVIRVDRAGRPLYASPAIASLTGLAPRLPGGRTLAELGLPATLQRLVDGALGAPPADGRSQRALFEADTPKGRRWFDAVVAPEANAAGDVETLLLIARDITDMRLAEASAREMGNLARKTLDALSAQVAILDRDGVIIAVNRAWRTFASDNAGITSRVLDGANYLGVCDATPVACCGEGALVAGGIRAVMRGECEEFALEYPCHSPTEQRWFTARVTRFAGDGDPRIVVAHENITVRRAAEARVAHYRDHLEEQVALRTQELARSNDALVAARDAADDANRAKSDFLAHMSHEIRTPVSAIIGMARILRGELVEAGPLAHLARLEGAAGHLTRIVDDVLDLSQIEAGLMQLEEAPFSLRQMLTHAVDMVEQRALEKGLRIDIEIDPGLPEVLVGDALRLEQIVLNFLSNAVKFTRRGAIRVRAGAAPSQGRETTVRIEVHDDGIGITPDEKERLFQDFSQADRSTARRYGGSGLGLVISRRLARLMRGDVGLASEPGAGSTFWTTAVLRSSDGAQTRVDDPPTRHVDATDLAPLGWRVLVVDDDPVNQLIAVHALRAMGVSADVADDGAQALQAIRRNDYSIVLMDMHMPVLDGLAATRLIRETHDRRALPVIAMTATTLETDRRACLEAGMNEHVCKPLDPAQLRAALLRYAAAR